MRVLLVFALMAGAFLSVKAQSDTIFYDSDWETINREQASFYRPKPVQTDSGYIIKDYYISGKKQFDGMSSDTTTDNLTGVATWYYETGVPSQIRSYENGKIEGNIIYYNKYGKVVASMEYKNGNAYSGKAFNEGEGADYFVSYVEGKKVKIDVISSDAVSKAHCNAIFSDSDHVAIKFYNQKGEFVGNYQISTADSVEVSTGTYVSYVFNPMIVDAVSTLENNKLIGPKKYYYSNGTLKRLDFSNDDSETTKEITYSMDGKLLDSLIYIENSPYQGTKYEFIYPKKSAFEADNLERSTRYFQGLQDGQTVEYFPNGKIQSKKNYKKGDFVGSQTYYDNTGKLIATATYKDGSPWEGVVYDNYYNSYTTYKNGESTSEKSYYTNGKLQHVRDLTYEESFDSLGVSIAHMDYKDGSPYNGKSLTIYDGVISSMEQYVNGNMVLAMSYSEGVPSSKTIYTSDGVISEKTDYYSNGVVQTQTAYMDGSENKILYFSKDGKALGKLNVDAEGVYDGEYYQFEDDYVVSIDTYKTNKVIKSKKYNADGVIITNIDFNGPSTFYDVSTSKTYNCTYKNGEPFDGNVVEFDSYESGISSLKSYKNGAQEGESINYTYNYETSERVPSSITIYKNGKREGIQKEFKNDILISSIMYQNDLANGETKFYNLEGKLLSTAIYKDDEPFSGLVYEFDSDHQVTSTTPYSKGGINGEAKYFAGEAIDYTFTYKDNVIQKRVSYINGEAKYTLTYQENEIFAGKEYESNTLSEYANGKLVSSVEYSDFEQAQFVKKRVANGELFTETIYYPNNITKSIITYNDSQKEGNAKYFDANGIELASGVYKSDLPIKGSFVYFNNDSESAYLLLQLQPQKLTVTEFNEVGKPISKMSYDLLMGDADATMEDEIAKILSGLSTIYQNYSFESGYAY